MLIDKLWQVNIVTRDSSGNILTTTDYSGDVVAGDVSLDYQLKNPLNPQAPSEEFLLFFQPQGQEDITDRGFG